MMDRRQFFGKTLSGAAGLGVLGMSAQGRPETAGAPDAIPDGASGAAAPVLRPLGKTGLSVPVVSMGVMNTKNPDLVRHALEKGMRHLDTAFAYGDGASESMVGRVVANMKLRDQVVIATKELTPWQRRRLASDKAKEALVRMAEASLARLKSDYVDILYVHDISTVEEVRHPGFMEALQQLKRQGKVRFVGFSSHGNMAACLDEAVRLGVYDVVLVAWNYALAEDAALRASMQKAAEKGIGLVAMKTQCSQYWYSQDLPDEQRRFYDGKGMHSAMLKWAVQHPFIATAVPGFTTFQQFDEDWAVASNLAFTPAEKRFFEERKIKVSLGYCVQCGACKPSCRNGADVPALMRVHMYLSCYGNFEVARRALQGVPGGAGISACASCGDCAARCVRDVPVEARIKDLRTLLG